MVRALVHTVVENHVAFTARKGIFAMFTPSFGAPLWGAETVLLVKPILERRGSEVSGRATRRSNERTDGEFATCWRPVILLAPMLVSTGSSMI